MEYTLYKYMQILNVARNAGFELTTFRNWFESGMGMNDIFLIRHDVDRHPERALAMAKIEAQENIAASYYFRILPCSFNPNIIDEIANLGHEIGYHYEDWYLARYNKSKAISLFRDHLEQMRKIAPINTIAMHGSPLSRESNLTIWDHYNLCKDGVKDVIMSADFSNFVFFTDTGRTFGQSKVNLRDFVGSKIVYDDVRSSDDLVNFLNQRRHNQVYFSVHPERWTDKMLDWGQQFVKDKAINGVKLALKLSRNIRY